MLIGFRTASLVSFVLAFADDALRLTITKSVANKNADIFLNIITPSNQRFFSLVTLSIHLSGSILRCAGGGLGCVKLRLQRTSACGAAHCGKPLRYRNTGIKLIAGSASRRRRRGTRQRHFFTLGQSCASEPNFGP